MGNRLVRIHRASGYLSCRNSKPRLGRGLRLDGGKIALFFDDLGSHRYATFDSALLNLFAARDSACRKWYSIHS